MQFYSACHCFEFIIFVAQFSNRISNQVIHIIYSGTTGPKHSVLSYKKYKLQVLSKIIIKFSFNLANIFILLISILICLFFFKPNEWRHKKVARSYFPKWNVSEHILDLFIYAAGDLIRCKSYLIHVSTSCF